MPALTLIDCQVNEDGEVRQDIRMVEVPSGLETVEAFSDWLDNQFPDEMFD